ncbi:MAG: tRNA-intron lyase [Candidatus Korarchaeota archaeon]|nr:tRNA-intron lyase [Candidatus Korarchaeota archaeon]
MAVRGILRDKYVYVTGDRIERLYRQGYGELRDGELELHPLEAAYLLWSGRIEVINESGSPVELRELLKLFVGDPKGFLKYIVYSDLRRRDMVVAYERATEFLRLYPKGARIGEVAAKDLVLPLSEDQPIPHKYILDMVERVARLRKGLILAVVDDEMNITYYRAQNFIPDRREGYDVDELPILTGTLVGDRVIIFEENAGELYAMGFWGHPLGVDKPEPFKLYEVPLQLPLIEALYLASKGKLRVMTYDGDELTLEDLRKVFSSMREDSGIREKVYRYWRDLGYVPKAGSKYGTDFMVYEKGPGLEHAPYLCIAGSVKEKVRPVDLIRSGRVATSVRKDLIVSLVSGEHVISYKITWLKP